MNGTTKHKVLKIKGGDSSEVEDIVAQETRLSVSVNGKHVLSLYCTPLMIRELVVGLLMTEGIADGICTERMTIVYGDEINVDVIAEGDVTVERGVITSGCVGGITFRKKHSMRAKRDRLSITSSRLLALFKKFHDRSELYNKTGCIHSAALSDGDEIYCFAEDIGRHNAVDKVIGYCILEGIDFRGKVMLASGRLSSEIVSKCAKWGVPMVVSRTAPTALALKIAEESGVTVVGFVRGKRMNVYTHKKRVRKE